MDKDIPQLKTLLDDLVFRLYNHTVYETTISTSNGEEYIYIVKFKKGV